MLPVYRLIGHKEYAAGRKSDPRYSMDWRRSRVAAFTPRGVDLPLNDADVAKIKGAFEAVLVEMLTGDTAPSLPAASIDKDHRVGPAKLWRWWQHSAVHAEKASMALAALSGKVDSLTARLFPPEPPA